MADFTSNDCINKEQLTVVLDDTEMTKLVCDRFLKYFGGHLRTKYLEDVADAVFECRSTSNLSSQIEEKIKDNFFHFLKYVISFFHVHGVTTSLMNKQHTNKLYDLIHELIPYTPVPDFIKLAEEVPHFPQATLEGQCNYQLPFFWFASETIEGIIRNGVQCVINGNQRPKQGDVLASVIAIMQKMIQVWDIDLFSWHVELVHFQHEGYLSYGSISCFL
jgi:hypothetical protein